MATLQNIGKLKYRGKDGQWHPLPVVVQDADGSVSTISGKGAPTSATQGKVNQFYRDEDTQRLYICTAADGEYTWAAVSGGSVDVDATLTQSGKAADAKAAGDAIGEKLDKTALPTAINDALAKAKASGAFDGAKGEKGDKGDTGPAGPKGETGPAGPKGADGKDGAGMDVTGAKVGQIAKITAVDAAGKPTEWEPVDMPSGEKKAWNKILEVEITEATGIFVVNGLDNYTDFIIFDDGMYNNTTVQSGMDAYINDIRITAGAISVPKKDNIRYSWRKLTYDGFTWLTLASSEAIDKRHTLSTTLMPYYAVTNVGKATSIKLSTPNNIYAPIAGKITIYGR